MIQKYINPEYKKIKFIINRSLEERKDTELSNLIESILNNVKLYGDKALTRYTKKYDLVEINEFKVTEKEFYESEKMISKSLKESIKIAYKNINYFHKSSIKITLKNIKTMNGVTCWGKNIPIEKIGLYIPGGTAPLLSTVLMLGIPGKLAGCKKIILCTPPDKNGKIHPSILFTSKFLGIRNVYKIGGAQAIAAMTYGTESIPNVNKIFGPGNKYVTKAKQIISQRESVSIDIPAGPSEMVIIADNEANPSYVASDILSQSEHDSDSYIIILSTNKNSWIKEMLNEIKKQFSFLKKRNETIRKSLKKSKIIILPSLKECFLLSNKIAPEHLVVNCKNSLFWEKEIVNAGSVFFGNYSPVSAGDYVTGTNHVLPTNGYAKSCSGVSIIDFFKRITFQKVSKRGLMNLSKSVNVLSEEEGLLAHRESINIRMK